jgi:uncharacterized protein YfaT (DUF1175 family)
VLKTPGCSVAVFVCSAAIFVCSAATAVGGTSARQPLHLDSPIDRDAFRRWFTFLSEAQFYRTAPAPEIIDCAALVRWSFRETIAQHDSAWANLLGLSVLPAIPPIGQFAWPRTPAGADLFRTGDTSAGQFADVTTLRRYNAYFVSRDLGRARPGDLIFYRQFGRTMAAHVMIYIGSSQFEPSARRWMVYHTGPSSGGVAGEIRKVEVNNLLAHPAPEWRPVPGNSNFLGVWRLNIVRDSV